MRALLLVLLLVGGCATAPHISLGERSLNLKVGMSKEQVWSLLGKPQTTSAEGNRETWQYWQNTFSGRWLDSLVLIPGDPMFSPAYDRLSVSFVDGKLDSWGDQAGMAGMMRGAMQAWGEGMKNMPPMKVDATIQQPASSNERKP